MVVLRKHVFFLFSHERVGREQRIPFISTGLAVVSPLVQGDRRSKGL